MAKNINNEYVSPTAVGEPRKKVYINSTSEYVKRNAFGERLGVYDLPNFSKKVCWFYSRIDNQSLEDLNLVTPDNPDDIVVDYVVFDWQWMNDGTSYIFGVKNYVRYSKWSNQGKFPYSDYYNADGTINGNNLFALQNGGLEIYKTAGPNILVQANRDIDPLPVYTCNILDDSKFNDTEPHDTDFIVTEDLYLDGYRPHFGINNRFILDGGNMIKYYSGASTPDKIICRSGNLIVKTPECFNGLVDSGFGSFTIKHPTTGAQLTPLGDRGDYDIVFDAADFMTSSDYVICKDWVTRIDLNSILDRIVEAIIPHPNNTSLNILVQFPQTNYGNGFYMRKTFDVPYGMTIDFGGINIWISNNYLPDGQTLEFKSALEWNGITNVPDFNYAFGFTRHPTLPSIVYGTIRNTQIWVENDVSPDQLRVVLNLRHFSGVLENVNFNLRNFIGNDTYPKGPYLLAMWQPLTRKIPGQGHESYSDQKIIRKCGVTFDAGRIDTPLAIFCHGDGYIIEQCNLGYVAILFGRGGVITGCLNTKFFLFETTVNFIDAYFEVGQFEILNSQVKFSSGVITAQDNHHGKFTYNMSEAQYYGPWFAIDMEFSKMRLRHFLKDLHVNCNDVFWENDSNGHYYKYAKQVRPSTVEFDPTLVCETIYWGYQQPVSGQLFVKGKNARIIGMENFESIQRVFSNEKNALLPVYIPLINNQFDNFHTIVEIPSNMRFNIEANQGHYPSEDYHITGSEWSSAILEDSHIDYPDPNPPIPAPDPILNGTTWKNISAFIEVDNKRRLRSYIISSNEVYELRDGAAPSVEIFANFLQQEHTNLNVVFRSSFNNKLYEARIQFKRADHISEIAQTGDTSNLIDNQINPLSENAEYPIAGFAIMQAVNPTANDFIGTDFSLELYNEYGYNQPGVKYKHAYGNFEYIGDDNTRDNYTECSRLIPLNEVNVRAYVNQIPLYGEWVEGDEIIVTYSDGGHEWLIYMHGYWMNPYNTEDRATK